MNETPQQPGTGPGGETTQGRIIPEEQLPPPDGEPRPIPETGASDPNLGEAPVDSGKSSNPGETPDAPSEDGRWDLTKAATLAPFVKGEDFDEKVRRREEFAKHVGSGAFVDRKTETERNAVAYRARQVGEYTDRTDLDPDGYLRRGAEEQLKQAKQELAEAEQRARLEGQKGVERRSDEIEQWVDERLSPYEELYDTNPDLFANMPTSEYMQIARELNEATSQMDYATFYLGRKTKELERFEEDLRQKRVQSGEGMVEAYASILYRHTEGDSDYKQVEEELNDIREDSFNKSPREMMEAYLALGKRLHAKLEEMRASGEAKRKEILEPISKSPL